MLSKGSKQLITLKSRVDDVYHDRQTFYIDHYVESDDTTFQTKTDKTLLVVVDAVDDDFLVPGMDLTKTVFTRTHNGLPSKCTLI
jgi:hypothetical protein